MIDSHHHLWRYSQGEYPWIPADSPLAQDQLVPELQHHAVVVARVGILNALNIDFRPGALHQQRMHMTLVFAGLLDRMDLRPQVVGAQKVVGDPQPACGIAF